MDGPDLHLSSSYLTISRLYHDTLCSFILQAWDYCGVNYRVGWITVTKPNWFITFFIVTTNRKHVICRIMRLSGSNPSENRKRWMKRGAKKRSAEVLSFIWRFSFTHTHTHKSKKYLMAAACSTLIFRAPVWSSHRRGTEKKGCSRQIKSPHQWWDASWFLFFFKVKRKKVPPWKSETGSSWGTRTWQEFWCSSELTASWSWEGSKKKTGGNIAERTKAQESIKLLCTLQKGMFVFKDFLLVDATVLFSSSGHVFDTHLRNLSYRCPEATEKMLITSSFSCLSSSGFPPPVNPLKDKRPTGFMNVYTLQKDVMNIKPITFFIINVLLFRAARNNLFSNCQKIVTNI